MKPYQFVVLRYVHDVTAGEFVNIGVVLWSPTDGFFSKVTDRYSRLSAFFPDFDGLAYRALVRHVTRALNQASKMVSEAQMPLVSTQQPEFAQILNSLVSKDSTVLQWSGVLGGATSDPAARFVALYEEFVGQFEHTEVRPRRHETQIRTTIDRAFRRHGLVEVSRDITLVTTEYDHTFPYGWVNGQQHVLEPISLDYLNSTDVIEKANKWTGRLHTLSHGNTFQFTGVVAAPDESLRESYEKAVAILERAPNVRRIVRDSNVDEVAEMIAADLKH